MQLTKSFYLINSIERNATFTGLSLRARDQGFSPATKKSGPRLLLLENRRNIEPKKIPSHLIPRLLVVFTWQLEILVTTLIYVTYNYV